MVRHKGPFRLANPWSQFAWLSLAAVLIVSLVLGFLVLSRYQQNGETLALWSAICRGLGITADVGPATQPQPPLRTPSRIAWTNGMIEQIRAGDGQHGSIVALNCTACHGEAGQSTSMIIPSLAGMDAEVIYKQLDDFRSGKRTGGVMNAIAMALSDTDSADVAAYFASRPVGPGREDPPDERNSKEWDTARRLIFVGDEERGIPPCAGCHGPLGHKIGAPTLTGQHAAYIAWQLAAFAQGTRQNDINEQMRMPAKELTPDEMHMIADFLGVPDHR
jgi:cytochrome c553